MLGFLEIEDLLEAVRSRDGSITSAVAVSTGWGGLTTFWTSFIDDDALAGRDFGDDSPETVSCPKNDHFFEDLGVDGPDPDAFATSDNNGREPRRLGAASGAFVVSRSRIGSAVLGRESRPLGSSNRLGFSFEGGEVVPAEMIDDIEFDSE